MDAEGWSQNKLLLALLEDLLGGIRGAEQEGPGVYYLSASGSENWSRGEYYVVWENAPFISKEAKSYGLLADQCPGLLLYSFARDDGGWRIIQYELYRYRAANKLPLPEASAFSNAAIYGAEIHPEYFGTYPVPVMTPWGYTLRHKALDNGIYWIETSQCDHVLAVCAPIWQELSSAAMELAIQASYDAEQGIDGPRFFDESSWCIPIWELLKLRREWELKIIDKAALMNAIWQRLPEYAAVHNAQVQQGLHDVTGLLLNAVGLEVELAPNMDSIIFMTPHAGSGFLHL